MNKITLEDRTKAPLIHVPSFKGLASFAIFYHHNARQPLKKIVKITLTTELKLKEEFLGDKALHIMSMVSKYRINIIDRLQIEDLTQIWFECAENLIEVFNSFEKKQF